jgi:hypothetical protein
MYPESQWAKQQQLGSRQISKKSLPLSTKDEKGKNTVWVIVGNLLNLPRYVRNRQV